MAAAPSPSQAKATQGGNNNAQTSTKPTQAVMGLPRIIAELQTVQTNHASLITDLRSQLSDSNRRAQQLQGKLVEVAGAYEQEMRHMRLIERIKDGLSKANLDAEKARNEVLQGRLKTLEAQLTLAKEQIEEDELELHLERSGKKEVEAELKMLKDGIEAREEAVRRREERMNEQRDGLLEALEKSKDALLGTKRPAHDSEVEDVPGPSTPKKMKTADGQQKSQGSKRGTRLSSRSKPHPTG
ncbi:hypothetical protein HMN09_00813900 [Mycena chlorophos]|uniref:Uncharacterized protein n=1 Tax=Mycena chlorophos TaxID=658473 RepID=A0A8H6SWG8_MYCCL|nr:hypothetical protein HMN09_00813900 [Mycena chlorophos]